MKEAAAKFHERLQKQQATLKSRFGIDFVKNERLAVMQELIQDHWPTITDPQTEISERVASIDDLIHSTALFSGRMKQDKMFARIMWDWNLIYAGWTNIEYMYDVERLLATGSLAPGKQEKIILADGTILLIEDDVEDSLSVLSPEDRKLRKTLFGNKHVMPYARFAFQYGVSDDRDVSPQYVLWLQNQGDTGDKNYIEDTADMKGGSLNPEKSGMGRTSTS